MKSLLGLITFICFFTAIVAVSYTHLSLRIFNDLYHFEHEIFVISNITSKNDTLFIVLQF